MTSPLLNVVVPFSRPEMAERVKANFESQSYSNKRLIVVENGRAIGAFQGDGVVLRSENHQSHAKNAGIDWACSHGGGLWTTFDDDDYYGGEYLAEIAENARPGEVLGKSSIFVRTIAGNVRRFRIPNAEGVHGSTISAWCDETLRFKDTGKWGEDWQFLDDMIRKGSRVRVLSENHYMLVRHLKNTWQIGDDSYVRRISFATHGNVQIDDFGKPREEVYDLIDNKIESLPSTEVPPDTDLQPTDSQAYVEMMKKATPIEDIAENMLEAIKLTST